MPKFVAISISFIGFLVLSAIVQAQPPKSPAGDAASAGNPNAANEALFEALNALAAQAGVGGAASSGGVSGGTGSNEAFYAQAAQAGVGGAAFSGVSGRIESDVFEKTQAHLVGVSTDSSGSAASGVDRSASLRFARMSHQEIRACIGPASPESLEDLRKEAIRNCAYWTGLAQAKRSGLRFYEEQRDGTMLETLTISTPEGRPTIIIRAPRNGERPTVESVPGNETPTEGPNP